MLQELIIIGVLRFWVMLSFGVDPLSGASPAAGPASGLYFQQFFEDANYGATKRNTGEKPCCYPPQWQGIVSEHDFNSNTNFLETIYVDQKNTRLALDITINGKIKILQIYLFHPSSKSIDMYQIDQSTKICLKGKFQNVTFEQVILPCMTDSAIYLGDLKMGDQDDRGDSMEVKIWMINVGGGGYYGRILSAKNCVPVFDMLTKEDPENFQYSRNYFNMKASIPDQSVFDVPSQCPKNLTKSNFERFHSRWPVWSRLANWHLDNNI